MSRRWLKWSVGGGAVAAAVVAAMAPWTFSAPALRAEVAEQVRYLTGLEAAEGGRVAISLLPQPRVKIEDIRFRDRDGGLDVIVDVLKGDLRLLPLLAGRLELSAATLHNPTIVVDADRLKLADDSAVARLAATPSGGELRLGTLTIVGGVARVRCDTAGTDTLVEDINATLEWRRGAAPAAVIGDVVWRGEKTEFSVQIGKPDSALRGGPTPLSIQLAAPSLNLSFAGAAIEPRLARLEGRFSATSPSLRRALRPFGIVAPLPGPLADASLAGALGSGQNSWSLTDLKLAADGNAYEGSLALRLEDGRASLSGTLASPRLVADPWLADLPAMRTPDGAWSREPLDPVYLGRVDLDLRVSTQKLQLRHWRFDDTAFAAILRRGKLELMLAEANGYKGKLKGRVAVTPLPGGAVDLRGGWSAAGVDFAALFPSGGSLRRLSGATTAQSTFETSGDSILRLMQNLDARGQMTIKAGEIAGIDIEQALRRLDKRPLALTLDARGGRTAFDHASAVLRMTRGDGEIADGLLANAAMSVVFAGRVQAPERQLSIRASAAQQGADAAARADAPHLRFDIVGGWDDPVVLPDTQMLLDRSDAAAPLLKRALGVAPAATVNSR